MVKMLGWTALAGADHLFSGVWNSSWKWGDRHGPHHCIRVILTTLPWRIYYYAHFADMVANEAQGG